MICSLIHYIYAVMPCLLKVHSILQFYHKASFMLNYHMSANWSHFRKLNPVLCLYIYISISREPQNTLER